MKNMMQWSGWVLAGIFAILLAGLAMIRSKPAPSAVQFLPTLERPATSPSGSLTPDEKRQLLGLQEQAARDLKFQESPWRLGRYPAVAPFEAVRWKEESPEVRVNGTWYALIALNDLQAPDIVGMCKSLDAKEWQKRFEDDLVAVLSQSGHAPGKTVTLRLRDLGDGNLQTLRDVPMTEANRTAVHDFRSERLIMGR